MFGTEVIHPTAHKEPVSLVHKGPFAQSERRAVAWKQLMLLTEDPTVLGAATTQVLLSAEFSSHTELKISVRS